MVRLRLGVPSRLTRIGQVFLSPEHLLAFQFYDKYWSRSNSATVLLGLLSMNGQGSVRGTASRIMLEFGYLRSHIWEDAGLGHCELIKSGVDRPEIRI